MIYNVFNFVGGIAGIISLVILLLGIGYWKRGVDERLGACKQCQEKYPQAETCRMVKTMWDIYVVGALSERPDLADHRSPLTLKPYGKEQIPQPIKILLDNINIREDRIEDIASGWLVVKEVGLATIEQFGKDSQLSLPLAIAVLSSYLDERRLGP